MRKLLLAAVALAGLASIATAQAAPILAARVFEDGIQIGGIRSDTDGDLSFTRITPDFRVTVDAFGIPLLASPSLAGQTTSVSALNSFSGTHTIRIEISQFDILTATATNGLIAALANSFTANFLNNPDDAITSVTISNYANRNNQRFAKQTQLASVTYTPAGGIVQSTGPITGTAYLNRALFSETIVIEATFTGGGAALQASSQIVGVPEPASLALFGTALLGLGLLRRSRQQA